MLSQRDYKIKKIGLYLLLFSLGLGYLKAFSALNLYSLTSDYSSVLIVQFCTLISVLGIDRYRKKNLKNKFLK